MEVTGKIKVLGDVQILGAQQNFKKRELVVVTEDQYPQTILIDFIQDKTELLNSYAVGQNVKVSINLGGREWINNEGVAKYFNSVTGWRIEKLAEANNTPQPNPAPVQNGVDDDFPF